MKSVLITRPLRQAQKFQKLLCDIDSIIISPLEIELLQLSESDQIKIVESNMSGAWSMFTSANAVSPIAPLLYSNMLMATVRDETASELSSYGLKTAFIPQDKAGKGMAIEFCEVIKDEIINQEINLFQGSSAGDEVFEILSGKGAKVNKYEVYSVREVLYEEISLIDIINFMNEVDENNIIMTFFSGKTIKSFVKIIKEMSVLSTKNKILDNIFNNIPAVVIGSKTKEVAIDQGFKNIIEADSKQSESMLRTIKSLVLPA